MRFIAARLAIIVLYKEYTKMAKEEMSICEMNEERSDVKLWDGENAKLWDKERE